MSTAKEIIDAFNNSPKKGLDKLLSNSEYMGKATADQFIAAEVPYNKRKEYLKLAEKIVERPNEVKAISEQMDAIDTELGISFDQRLEYEKAFKDVQNAGPGELKAAQQNLMAAESTIIGDSKKNLEKVRGKFTEAKSVEIATFLHENHKALNLHTLGEFLGEPQNDEILNAFANKMDFKSAEFDVAFRKYVGAFQMPGESQKIDKIMEAFGKAYHIQNPKKITTDAAHRSAFIATIFNSDLHNPAVKAKRSFESYTADLAGIDLPNKDVFFSGLYDSIKKTKLELSVSQILPGYEITDSSKSKDRTFDQIKGLFGKSQTVAQGKGAFKSVEFDVTRTMKTIFPDSKIEKATIDKPRSWLKRLMGYEGKITVHSKDEVDKNVKISMQFYTPSIFAKSKTPRLLVHPSHENMHPTKASLDFAARLASNFKNANLKVEATYDYSKKEMLDTYAAKRQAKGALPLLDKKGQLKDEYTPPLKLVPPPKEKSSLVDKIKSKVGLGKGVPDPRPSHNI
jgi:Sec7-like guanine-nucleotide exchange factor